VSQQLNLTVIYPGAARDCLLTHGELDEASLDTCFRHGAVWLQTSGKPRRLYDPQRPVKPGHKIHLYCNEFTLQTCPLQPQLVEDHTSFSVWNKPAGMYSQGSKWGDHWTLSRWIALNHWPDRECFITHRLDRYTRGLMIVAHDAACNRSLHTAFANREINKTYRAIVRGVVEGEPRTVSLEIDQRAAVTRIIPVQCDRQHDLSLVELRPETGRKHQLRVHLAAIGHPVLNDRLHGQPPHDGDLQLQASGLEFDHPVSGKRLQLKLAERQLLAFESE
jgi:tRNA pseudouridine32 synthase/23S rRNA pseudouridine746 synthase